jgi:hypothetical protein
MSDYNILNDIFVYHALFDGFLDPNLGNTMDDAVKSLNIYFDRDIRDHKIYISSEKENSTEIFDKVKNQAVLIPTTITNHALGILVYSSNKDKFHVVFVNTGLGIDLHGAESYDKNGYFTIPNFTIGSLHVGYCLIEFEVVEHTLIQFLNLLIEYNSKKKRSEGSIEFFYGVIIRYLSEAPNGSDADKEFVKSFISNDDSNNKISLNIPDKSSIKKILLPTQMSGSCSYKALSYPIIYYSYLKSENKSLSKNDISLGIENKNSIFIKYLSLEVQKKISSATTYDGYVLDNSLKIISTYYGIPWTTKKYDYDYVINKSYKSELFRNEFKTLDQIQNIVLSDSGNIMKLSLDDFCKFVKLSGLITNIIDLINMNYLIEKYIYRLYDANKIFKYDNYTQDLLKLFAAYFIFVRKNHLILNKYMISRYLNYRPILWSILSDLEPKLKSKDTLKYTPYTTSIPNYTKFDNNHDLKLMENALSILHNLQYVHVGYGHVLTGLYIDTELLANEVQSILESQTNTGASASFPQGTGASASFPQGTGASASFPQGTGASASFPQGTGDVHNVSKNIIINGRDISNDQYFIFLTLILSSPNMDKQKKVKIDSNNPPRYTIDNNYDEDIITNKLARKCFSNFNNNKNINEWMMFIDALYTNKYNLFDFINSHESAFYKYLIRVYKAPTDHIDIHCEDGTMWWDYFKNKMNQTENNKLKEVNMKINSLFESFHYLSEHKLVSFLLTVTLYNTYYDVEERFAAKSVLDYLEEKIRQHTSRNTSEGKNIVNFYENKTILIHVLTMKCLYLFLVDNDKSHEYLNHIKCFLYQYIDQIKIKPNPAYLFIMVFYQNYIKDNYFKNNEKAQDNEYSKFRYIGDDNIYLIKEITDSGILIRTKCIYLYYPNIVHLELSSDDGTKINLEIANTIYITNKHLYAPLYSLEKNLESKSFLQMVPFFMKNFSYHEEVLGVVYLKNHNEKNSIQRIKITDSKTVFISKDSTEYNLVIDPKIDEKLLHFINFTSSDFYLLENYQEKKLFVHYPNNIEVVFRINNENEIFILLPNSIELIYSENQETQRIVYNDFLVITSEAQAETQIKKNITDPAQNIFNWVKVMPNCLLIKQNNDQYHILVFSYYGDWMELYASDFEQRTKVSTVGKYSDSKYTVHYTNKIYKIPINNNLITLDISNYDAILFYIYYWLVFCNYQNIYYILSIYTYIISVYKYQDQPPEKNEMALFYETVIDKTVDMRQIIYDISSGEIPNIFTMYFRVVTDQYHRGKTKGFTISEFQDIQSILRIYPKYTYNHSGFFNKELVMLHSSDEPKLGKFKLEEKPDDFYGGNYGKLDKLMSSLDLLSLVILFGGELGNSDNPVIYVEGLTETNNYVIIFTKDSSTKNLYLEKKETIGGAPCLELVNDAGESYIKMLEYDSENFALIDEVSNYDTMITITSESSPEKDFFELYYEQIEKISLFDYEKIGNGTDADTDPMILPLFQHFKIFIEAFQKLLGLKIKCRQLYLIIRMLQDIFSEEETNFYQFIMGGGKTKVIIPMCALIAHFIEKDKKTNRKIIIVQPASLIKQTTHVLMNSILLLGSYTFKVVDHIDIVNHRKKKPSLELCDFNLFNESDIKKLILEGYPLGDCVFIYDEVDDLCNNLKSELNKVVNDNTKMDNIDPIFDYLYNKIMYGIETNNAKTQIGDQVFNHMKKTLIVLEQREYRLNYGLRDETFDDEIHVPESLFAVPFSGKDLPSTTSDFTDNYVKIAYTINSYKHHRTYNERDGTYVECTLRESDVIRYLKYLLMIYNQSGKYIPRVLNELKGDYALIAFDSSIEKYESWEGVKHALGDNLIRVLSNPVLMKKYLYYLCKTNLSITTKVKNCSFIDVMSNRISIYKIGLSGTPFIHKPIEKGKNFTHIKYQKGANGYIYKSMIDTKGPPRILQNSFDILSELNEYNVIIDVAAFFLKFRNREMAMHIYERVKIPVVYINESHNIMLYEGQTVDIVFNEDLNADYFYYFDQGHITGIDIKMKKGLNGFVSVNEKSSLRNIAQGIFRMRQINKGHQITFFTTTSEFNSNLKIINAIITVEDKYFTSLKPYFEIQNIRSMYRTNENNNDDSYIIDYNPKLLTQEEHINEELKKYKSSEKIIFSDTNELTVEHDVEQEVEVENENEKTIANYKDKFQVESILYVKMNQRNRYPNLVPLNDKIFFNQLNEIINNAYNQSSDTIPFYVIDETLVISFTTFYFLFNYKRNDLQFEKYSLLVGFKDNQLYLFHPTEYPFLMRDWNATNRDPPYGIDVVYKLEHFMQKYEQLANFKTTEEKEKKHIICKIRLLLNLLPTIEDIMVCYTNNNFIKLLAFVAFVRNNSHYYPYNLFFVDFELIEKIKNNQNLTQEESNILLYLSYSFEELLLSKPDLLRNIDTILDFDQMNINLDKKINLIESNNYKINFTIGEEISKKRAITKDLFDQVTKIKTELNDIKGDMIVTKDTLLKAQSK